MEGLAQFFGRLFTAYFSGQNRLNIYHCGIVKFIQASNNLAIGKSVDLCEKMCELLDEKVQCKYSCCIIS